MVEEKRSRRRKHNFQLLDKKICALFNKVKNHGKISIITNATESWVHNTLNHLPNTKNLLDNEKIILCSAQNKYKDTHELSEWKKHAFHHIVKKHMKGFVMNIFLSETVYMNMKV